MNSGNKSLDAGRIDLYLAVLARERLLLEQLHELLQEKRQYIVLAKPEELDKLNQKEGTLVSDLEKTEGARFKLQRDLASALQMDYIELTANVMHDLLVEYLPDRAVRMRELKDDIQRLLEKIQERTEENGQLLQIALEYVSEMQWMLSGEETAGTYSKTVDADLTPPPARNKIFDTKA